MPDELVLLEQIERYHTGVMEPTERTEWEQTLATDDALCAETASFEPLFHSWQALRNQTFGQAMLAWETEWEAVEETEAIEHWLSGHPGHDWVGNKAKTNPGFASKVEQQRQLLDGFSAARGQNFQKEMQSWEDSGAAQTPASASATIRPMWRRWAVAAVITPLLIVVAAAYWYAGRYYSNDALVAQFYQQPSLGNTMSAEAPLMDQLTQAFNTAHDQLYNSHYDAAITAFEKLSISAKAASIDDLSKQYFIQNAEWSLALAQLGAGKSDSAQATLRLIAENPNHAYKQQAIDLQRNLQAFFRKLAK